MPMRYLWILLPLIIQLTIIMFFIDSYSRQILPCYPSQTLTARRICRSSAMLFQTPLSPLSIFSRLHSTRFKSLCYIVCLCWASVISDRLSELLSSFRCKLLIFGNVVFTIPVWKCILSSGRFFCCLSAILSRLFLSAFCPLASSASAGCIVCIWLSRSDASDMLPSIHLEWLNFEYLISVSTESLLFDLIWSFLAVVCHFYCWFICISRVVMSFVIAILSFLFHMSCCLLTVTCPP